jgi:hypothetical protein
MDNDRLIIILVFAVIMTAILAPTAYFMANPRLAEYTHFDGYGSLDKDRVYECPFCGWRGTVEKMTHQTSSGQTEVCYCPQCNELMGRI